MGRTELRIRNLSIQRSKPDDLHIVINEFAVMVPWTMEVRPDDLNTVTNDSPLYQQGLMLWAQRHLV